MPLDFSSCQCSTSRIFTPLASYLPVTLHVRPFHPSQSRNSWPSDQLNSPPLCSPRLRHSAVATIQEQNQGLPEMLSIDFGSRIGYKHFRIARHLSEDCWSRLESSTSCQQALIKSYKQAVLSRGCKLFTDAYRSSMA